MDFISSISFPNEHFLAIFFITFGWVQQQSNSKPTQKWWQKWSRTDLRFIWKRNTTSKIHTLVVKQTHLRVIHGTPEMSYFVILLLALEDKICTSLLFSKWRCNFRLNFIAHFTVRGSGTGCTEKINIVNNFTPNQNLTQNPSRNFLSKIVWYQLILPFFKCMTRREIKFWTMSTTLIRCRRSFVCITIRGTAVVSNVF